MGFYWAVRVHGQFKLGCILLLIIMLKCAFGFHCFQMLGRNKKKEISHWNSPTSCQHFSEKKRKASVEFNGHKVAVESVRQSVVILTHEISHTLYTESLDSVRQIKDRLNLENLWLWLMRNRTLGRRQLTRNEFFGCFFSITNTGNLQQVDFWNGPNVTMLTTADMWAWLALMLTFLSSIFTGKITSPKKVSPMFNNLRFIQECYGTLFLK